MTQNILRLQGHGDDAVIVDITLERFQQLAQDGGIFVIAALRHKFSQRDGRFAIEIGYYIVDVARTTIGLYRTVIARDAAPVLQVT